MKKRPAAELSDYWELFLRRRWWILVPALLISIGSVTVVARLPKVYRSETLILVTPQIVPTEYVKPTVSSDDNVRLQTISQEILSRTRLQTIIDQFGLYRQEPLSDRLIRFLFRQGKRTQEDVIEEMRADIKLEPIIIDPEARDRSLGAFKISYESGDPLIAQQVTRQLASLFIAENVRVRSKQAEGTSEFIEHELDQAREALDGQEKRLSEFKASHMGSLPEQQDANLQILGQLQSSLQANNNALARAEDQKTYLQSVMSAMAKRSPQESKSPAAQLLETRRTELRVAEQMYKPDHPDVVRLKSEVKALEQGLQDPGRAGGASAAGAAGDDADSPAHMQSQIAALDQEIARFTKEQAKLTRQIHQVQGRVETLPAVEQQLAEISRGYDISKANYQTLVEKRDASAMAAEMESRAIGEQFRVLDPASFPEKPSKPDVAQLDVLGVLLGIVTGAVLGLFADQKDKCINTAKEATFYLSLPALASLPVITGLRDGSGSKASGKPPRFSLNLHLPSQSGNGAARRRAAGGPNGEHVEAGVNSGGYPEADATPAPASDAPFRRMVSQHWWQGSDEAGAIEPVEPPQMLDLAYPPARLVAGSENPLDEDHVFAREQFRMIRTRLLELMRVRNVRTLMVTSAISGEGKTLVSANLAYSMSALEGFKVLLVDADLRTGSLSQFFNMKPKAGLSTYLLNGKRLHDVRWQISPSLSMVPTPRLREGSAELFNGRRMKEFLQQAQKDHDLIVIDAPPLLTVADAQVLTTLVDAAILVVRAGTSPYDLARSAAELLQPKVVGVVVNGLKRFPGKRYYYGYYEKAERH